MLLFKCYVFFVIILVMLYMYYKVKDFGSLNRGMKCLVYKVY